MVVFSAVAKGRKYLENETFQAWVGATGDEKDALAVRLRALLCGHAQAICFMVLRRNDGPLSEEGADRVMLSLDSYNSERALFSTWAHAILMRVMYNQRRNERERKEQPLDTAYLLTAPSDLQSVELVAAVRKILSKESFDIFEQVVLFGRTQGEAAEELKISRASVVRKWPRIVRILRNALSEYLPSRR
jgi:hypothetical protein